MSLRDLVPWRWGRQEPDSPRGEEHPLRLLHRDMNRLFEDFFHGSELALFGERPWERGVSSPRVDVRENDKEVEITAEIPGIAEDDIEVSLSDDILTIKGETRTEREEEKGHYVRKEHSSRSFQRTLSIPVPIDSDAAEAAYKDGVLTVRLPKRPEAQAGVKKIGIKKG
ncbi:MAG: Hsp20/alpha crystallin family protein [Planctomycetota bacterium]